LRFESLFGWIYLTLVIPRCAIAHRGCAFGRQLPT
jgi:hypothetical protein